MRGAGNGFGEPTEIVNATIGSLASTTSRMTPGHRHDALERHTRTLNLEKRAVVNNILARQYLRAKRKAKIALDDAQKLEEEATFAGADDLTIDLKEHEGFPNYSPTGATNGGAPTDEAKRTDYIIQRVKLAYLKGALDPVINTLLYLLFPISTISKMAKGAQSTIANATGVLRKFANRLGHGFSTEEPPLASDQFQRMVLELAKSKATVSEGLVNRHLLEVNFFKARLRAAGGQSDVQKSIHRSIEKAKKAADTELRVWCEWNAAAISSIDALEARHGTRRQAILEDHNDLVTERARLRRVTPVGGYNEGLLHAAL
eukprot:CAMPEP_0182874702 /NCGR_PEP_ID=MMETSP0034_2-20130328/13105_1 /TAXON_ID=156128 /ORGANISM="Nephroselmis pyriformis, Strain CCMP717" /LENGTH=316 /DNA_ID=CAMNT_0025007425 /DNA_START=48 /DNA_END=995 /DNA_ORIENTATION=+